MRLPSRFVSLRCTLPPACAFALGASSAHAAVFINELHYDDAGAPPATAAKVWKWWPRPANR